MLGPPPSSFPGLPVLKTTVAGKLVERFTHRRNILYHRCQTGRARACLESVAEWLANMGDASFSDYLAATPVPQLPMLPGSLQMPSQGRRRC